MPGAAISVENLSKRYLVGHRAGRGGGQGDTALRDTIRREFRNAARKAVDIVSGRQVVQGDEVEEFWALKDVSFEVKEGEVLGIIGRNGAGKSTLLKILSRITEPTSGRVTLRGRVASLLEVGTGFHPELSGSENIYLNGAILGMSRAEIKRKFDEIVAFSEIEKFLDTPVKRYSSGMYVRLAFAVAAHLEPEILIVDEVLAVGDAEFQKKCLGKMSEVAGGGRTVLFVSHNMSATRTLCSRGIHLADGRVQMAGGIMPVIASYLSNSQTSSGIWHIAASETAHRMSKKLFFTSVSILNNEGIAASKLAVSEPFQVRLEFEMAAPIADAELVARVETADGTPIFSSTHALAKTPSDQGRNSRSVEIPAMFLMPGAYSLTVSAHSPMVEIHDLRPQLLRFDVIDTGTALARHGNYKEIGIVIVDLPWRVALDA